MAKIQNDDSFSCIGFSNAAIKIRASIIFLMNIFINCISNPKSNFVKGTHKIIKYIIVPKILGSTSSITEASFITTAPVTITKNKYCHLKACLISQFTPQIADNLYPNLSVSFTILIKFFILFYLTLIHFYSFNRV